MDEDLIADLKQFIDGAVTQQTSDLLGRLDQMATKDDLASAKHDLSNQIADLRASVSEALDTANDAVHAQLQDHERRLTTLEHNTA